MNEKAFLTNFLAPFLLWDKLYWNIFAVWVKFRNVSSLGINKNVFFLIFEITNNDDLIVAFFVIIDQFIEIDIWPKQTDGNLFK